MEENKNNQYSQFTDNDDSDFVLKEWLLLFLHYWYLFLFFIILALGAAYLKNRTWIETYQSKGTIIIEESRNTGSQAFMQGFGVQSGYRNVDNQTVMLTSYDLISRVVDSIPFLSVDYITKSRFKTRNLYNETPIVINIDFVDPKIYGVMFKLSINSDGTYVITDENGTIDKTLTAKGRLGIPIQHNLFFITVEPTSNKILRREIYFRFRSKESLISDFMSRLQIGFVQEGSSVLGISLTSETPDRDIDFINKLCSVFLTENLERKNDAASKTMDLLTSNSIPFQNHWLFRKGL